MTKKETQRGAALAIGLILMAVATVVSVAAMHAAGTEERIAANQRDVAVAFMAAETGLSKAIAWLDSSGNAQNCWDDDGSECSAEINKLDQSVPGDYEGTSWTVAMSIAGDTAELVSQGMTAANTSRIVRVLYTLPTDPGPNPAFLKGLLSDRDILVTGASVFRGSAHANRDFTNRAGGSSLIDAEITAHRTAIYQGSGGPAKKGERIDVPSAESYILGAKDAGGVINSCTIESYNPPERQTYFCDGDLTVSGAQDMSRITLLVNGNVTWNGSAPLGGEGELTVAVIATGNIILNGERDSYGVWWADGTVRQNGSSVLGGAVVAGFDIERRGSFTFEQRDDFGDIDLPMVPGLPSNARGWRELKIVN